jgi:hypothetical protein
MAEGTGAAGIDALAHLQNAVLEMIAAARSALDVAEELIKDPSPLLSVVQNVAPSKPATETAARVEHIPVQ